MGTVTSRDTGEPMVGANVYLEGTAIGAATDAEGMFRIEAADGKYNLTCEYVGYASQTVVVDLAGQVTQDFTLEEYLFAKTIDVIADRAIERKTPVAFTNVEKKQMETQLGSQDIPMVLNTTPSVYATMQGGGAGDARINLRGFNQRNIAIMINGVPVNDMENGWVYWSNWDGVGDATSSIQVQRGLSAVNLATPSVGGTMNVITDPTANEFGLKFKQEYGSGTFLKTTVVANSGLIDNKFAFNVAAVRKIGDGVIDKTWTDAWAYYFGASWNINQDNRLELYALGAPQRHGQNLYMQNIAVYDQDFAKDLPDYDRAAFDKFDEKGREFNQNWAPVSSSYKGKQNWNESDNDRYDEKFINERENFFHKPQVNLNWYSRLSDRLGLYSVFYYSGGHGGGTGTAGRIYTRDSDGNLGDDDYKYYYGDSPWVRDWDATIAMNSGPAGTYYVDKRELTKEDGESLGILRNSRNNQYQIGSIIKANYKWSDNAKSTFGVDWRTAEIEHYREVRDLLGGDFYIDDGNEFDNTAAKQRKGLGDKVIYNFTNTVDWIGGFFQSEVSSERETGYAMFGYSTIKYKHTNHFKAADTLADGSPDLNSGELELEPDQIDGFQVKGGYSYRVDENFTVFGNAGYVSNVPILDAVINDQVSELIDDPQNEKITSLEAGLQLRDRKGLSSLKLSGYYTIWNERTVTDNEYDLEGNEGLIVITGMNANYSGVELEWAFRPSPFLRFDAAGSIGYWVQQNDPQAIFKNYDTGTSETVQMYLDGLRIGEAPQSQFALATTVYPITGMQIQGVYRYYANYYAAWNAPDRIDPNDRKQSWKVPDYGVFDLHASYNLPLNLNGVNFEVFAHVFNALDAVFIQDAVDNSQYNAYTGNGKTHSADDAEVFFGLPRTINVGITVSY